ncbi:bifunctional diguanylate cyclase/phosphodiesterase [Cellulomonas carbonis]|uniref:Diguanylate phosphodiesterase n=1 Tax=Cellulomonas carbonis T26 TaxID=947969 RepID=A0A0A0BQV5_9CELL|nr:EAL domain-containing protein [Cellulomonas carbonis]KGM10848.1 diguanylate phosphodiesterase [Cellulomonas carbonis T26]GGB92394.1 hypothetical protein GCM10010972_01350 [Cellulomonas carbonis]
MHPDTARARRATPARVPLDREPHTPAAGVPALRETAQRDAGRPPGEFPWAATAAWSAVYLLAGVLGGITRLPSPPVAFVWPAAGVALLWFVLTPREQRYRVAMPTLLVMAFLANVTTGASAITSLAFALANVAHAVVGGGLFLRLAPHTPDSLRDARGLLALGAGSLAGSLAGTPLILALIGPNDLPGALSIIGLWIPRFTASTAVVMAFVLAWRAHRADRRAGVLRHARSRGEIALVLSFALAVHVIVDSTRPDDAFAFLTLPVTVLVGWRLGPAWTATYGLVAGAVGVVATLGGAGPFAEVAPVTTRTVVVQAFIAVTGLVGLALSLEVEQRRLALEASDRRGDALERTLQRAVVPNALLSLEEGSRGTIRYANPALERWWSGDDGEALAGRTWAELLGPDEHAGFLGALDDLAAGRIEVWEGEVAHRTRSGEDRMCLAVAGLVGREHVAGSAERVATVQLVDVTDRTALEERLAHQALHDQLTGLPNRTLLQERIDHAIAAAPRSGRAVAVLFLDLDHFKRVNDSLGHAAGDTVLVEVASRLVEAVRPGDTVARIGGDEFVVCCPLVEDRHVGAELATRILRQVCRPITLEGRTIPVSASIGMTLARPGTDAGDLLREADTAMYEAKLGGRGRTAFFSDPLFDRVRLDLQLDSELRRAVDEKQFVVHFQPIVQIETGRVCAVEALLRWAHPARGLLLPGEWIDAAEAAGLMPELGEWALGEAFAQWPRIAQLHGEHVSVNVNVSASQLRDGGFAAVVEHALQRTGMPPDRAVLELTESHLLTIRDSLVEELERVRGLGVRLAVDDFGTGYSSLTQLTVLPIDEVKIDRSFVSAMSDDARSRAVVEGVVAMARAMSLAVVAEGVETTEIARRLSACGCPTAQGYLWGRPAALEP